MRVNVVAAHRVAVASVPETALVPLQPPPALHHVAFVADQVSVAGVSGTMFACFAEKETAGVRFRLHPLMLLHGASTHDELL